nr:unnamed protein product [Digitaria exilis]
MPTLSGAESMHVILVPFPAQGHFAAFLSLADRLHAARPSSTTITLVSTPRNVASLRASSSSSSPFLRFHALPFSPEDHGLPTGAESADAVHVTHFLALFQSTSSASLQSSFDAFVVNNGVADDDGIVVVVADPFMAWTTGVARRRGARHAFFDSCGAFGSAVYHSLWNHLPHHSLRRSAVAAAADDESFDLPDHPEVTVHRSQLPAHLLVADGTDPWSVFHRRQISLGYDTDAVLVNTTEEFELAGLRMLRRAMGGVVPVLPIGPLVRVPTTKHITSDSERDSDIVRWLDARDKSSVLYISFGSQNSLRPEQMMELGAALELTGRPFGDQFFNCKMLEQEWGACVEVARGNDGAVVERARLAEGVEMVMGGDSNGKGPEMRRRVKEIQELMALAQRKDGGSSAQALDEFFTTMLRGGTV